MAEGTGSTEAGWHPDPFGRHEHRYWDGGTWTDQVSDAGQVGTDPAVAVAATGPAAAPASPPAPGGGRRIPTAWLAVGGAAVAALVVVLLVVLLGGGDDDDGGIADGADDGTGEFAGTISEDAPFLTRTVEIEAGGALRVVVEPSSGLDARVTLSAERGVIDDGSFLAAFDIAEADEDELASTFDEVLSDVGDDDVGEDLSDALSDDFSDFIAVIDEEVPSLSDVGIPLFTANRDGEGDPEGLQFLAPVSGTYTVIISGQDSDGDVEGAVDVASPGDEFDPDDFDEDSIEDAFAPQFESHRDFLCDEDFFSGDSTEVVDGADSLCDEPEADTGIQIDGPDDDGPPATQVVEVGGRATGSAAAGGPPATFAVEGRGSEVTIDVLGGRTVPPELDPILVVRDSSGTIVGENDDVEPGIHHSQLVLTLEDGEEYLIEVSAYGTTSGEFELLLSES